MIIIPAIDLKDNKCVRLSKGQDETSVVFNDDPQKQAVYFEKLGCKKLHIVDLDAAFGRPEKNTYSIKKIREATSLPIQLGGGIRSRSDAERYFDLGIDNLIIGSMSINQPETVKSLSNFFKNKIYISLDVKKDNVMIKGWKEKSKLNIDQVVDIYKTTEIKGYVITDVENDGMLRGLNTDFLQNITKRIQNESKTNQKIIIAGGLTNYNDLNKLVKLNIKNLEGIISGKSFYVGNIDLTKAQKIISANG